MQENLFGFLKAQDVEIFENYPLSKMSSIRIGGRALVLRPRSIDGLIRTVDVLGEQGTEYKIVGRMSNVLPPDGSYGKSVICTADVCAFRLCGDILVAECGATFRRIATRLAPLGYGGYEELVGIPGTVGGLVTMNAGAYGRSISDLIEWADVYSPEERNTLRVDGASLGLSYRDSHIGRRGWILLSAGFKLRADRAEAVLDRISELRVLRRASQPTEFPSLGSVFKRPANGIAARMIDECGLKGVRCGDAQVSVKHAGFIVNLGKATSEQYISLMEKCRCAVQDKFGVSLEPEIEIL